MVGPAKHLYLSLQVKDTILQHLNVQLIFSISLYFGSSICDDFPFAIFVYLFLNRWAFTKIISLYILKVIMRRLLSERRLQFLQLFGFNLEWFKQASKMLVIF